MSTVTGAEAGEHRDHADEQAYLTGARAALDAMIRRSEQALEFSEHQVEQEQTVESRIVRSHLADRRAAVDVGRVNLCFGRIDEDPILSDGDQWYVGRRHIEDAVGDPVVVDWRAPVAIPFYRATAADPFGLARRRRFSTDGDELLAIFDEQLDDPSSVSASGIPDPVIAEIERARSGEMADIVATIAAEQDQIIRAPLNECLLVQGGPGTGKTAVGLHRAAFLLFEHREALSQSHVLVLGPNPIFLRYVANVLPSLGETAVTQTTLTSLLSARVRVRGQDEPSVEEIKGRAEMAEVIRRLAVRRIAAPTEEVAVAAGVRVVRWTPEAVADAIATAAAAHLPINEAKTVFVELMLRGARAQLSARGLGPEELATAIPAVRSHKDFRKAVNKAWPSLSGPQMVRSLLSSPTNRERAAEGLLTESDQQQMHRRSTPSANDEPWTAADLALLDEANHITIGTKRRFGHIVIDEAQDLSAMALRAAGRRAIGESMTILGDIAQATGVSAQTSWASVTSGLGFDPAAVREQELTVGYRVPGPILDFANRLLAVTAPQITPSTSIRSRGRGPQLREVGATEIVAEVTRSVGELSEEATTVGIIACAPHQEDLLAALDRAGIDAGDTRRGATLESGVSLVDPALAKGLEFDATVVVEPADFETLPNGLRLLYVALTRCVQELVVVHAAPLPSPLLN